MSDRAVAIEKLAPVETASLGLKIYLLLVISWFLRIPTRIEFLGLLRFDLILIILLTFVVISKKEGAHKTTNDKTTTGNLLKFFLIYAIITIPLVEWPGSVIRFGIINWIKAAVFYYFTIAFVRTESDLKKLIFVFLACQAWRILEPLYLHVTEGYWGNVAYMTDNEALERLSGAPYDIVNANGLAFVICTVLPFLYFMAGLSLKSKLAFFLLIPPFLYALVLTGSRSGVIGLVIIFLGILVKSKNRIVIGLLGVSVAIVSFSFMTPNMQDRYLSIIGKGEKNKATFEGRNEGNIEIFREVVLRRPLFGYGLGTSREANANFGGSDQPAHNLYVEAASEVGLIGTVVFVLFIRSIVVNFVQSQKILKIKKSNRFLLRLNDAMQVWLAMNIIFSFASYGVSSYEWYLFAGLSVVILRISQKLMLASNMDVLDNAR